MGGILRVMVIWTVVVAVVVVVLTLTRIIRSVVTRHAPVTLELRNTPRKTHTQAKVVHAYVNNMGYGVRKARPVRCPTGVQRLRKMFLFVLE